MSLPTFSTKRPTPERIDVTVSGALTPEVATQIAQAVGAMPSGQRRKVMIDFRELESCPLAARSILISVHKTLKENAVRIAYVADTSLMRGLALWLCHLSEDQNAKPFATKDQAEEWLKSTTQRVSDTHARFSAAAASLAKREG